MLKRVLLFNFFILLLLNAKSQECYTIQKDVESTEDWKDLLDSLFQQALLDSNDVAYALLVLKVDSSGTVMSTHILNSRNMDSTYFYSICSKIEDCYSYSFLIKECQSMGTEYKKLISKEYMYMQYVYRFHPNIAGD
jgi:hypothetical protein